ncbi:hypothetical protein ACJEM9_24985, partial [Escherichia coli]
AKGEADNITPVTLSALKFMKSARCGFSTRHKPRHHAAGHPLRTAHSRAEWWLKHEVNPARVVVAQEVGE